MASLVQSITLAASTASTAELVIVTAISVSLALLLYVLQRCALQLDVSLFVPTRLGDVHDSSTVVVASTPHRRKERFTTLIILNAFHAIYHFGKLAAFFIVQSPAAANSLSGDSRLLWATGMRITRQQRAHASQNLFSVSPAVYGAKKRPIGPEIPTSMGMQGADQHQCCCCCPAGAPHMTLTRCQAPGAKQYLWWATSWSA